MSTPDNETRALMLETLDRVIASTLTPAMRQAADLQVPAGQSQSGMGDPLPATLWQALAEQGLTAIGEEAEGDLGYANALSLAARMAYHAAPIPYGETILARRLLQRCQIELPEGPITLAPPAASHDVVKAHAGQLRGLIARVPWGRAVPHVVIAAGVGSETALVLARIAGAPESSAINMAGEPRDTLDCGRLEPVAVASLAEAARTLETEGALMRSAQLAGALAAVLDHCLQWVNDRIQFGKPIARFQAVQHLMAELAAETAAARAAADLAITASVRVPDRLAIAIAKSRAGEAAGRGSAIAHQLYGAMGFTKEHPLHYATRRLWAWRDEFGSEVHWQADIGRSVASAGADRLWPLLTRLG